jgi:hypothetical protein
VTPLLVTRVTVSEAVVVTVSVAVTIPTSVTVFGSLFSEEQNGFPSGESVTYLMSETCGVQYDFGGLTDSTMEEKRRKNMKNIRE